MHRINLDRAEPFDPDAVRAEAARILARLTPDPPEVVRARVEALDDDLDSKEIALRAIRARAQHRAA